MSDELFYCQNMSFQQRKQKKLNPIQQNEINILDQQFESSTQFQIISCNQKDKETDSKFFKMELTKLKKEIKEHVDQNFNLSPKPLLQLFMKSNIISAQLYQQLKKNKVIRKKFDNLVNQIKRSSEKSTNQENFIQIPSQEIKCDVKEYSLEDENSLNLDQREIQVKEVSIQNESQLGILNKNNTYASFESFLKKIEHVDKKLINHNKTIIFEIFQKCGYY